MTCEENKNVTYAGDVVVVAHSFGQQPVADFPGEDGGALAFVVRDFGDHRCGCYSGFRTADGARFDRTGLVVPAVEQNTNHTYRIRSPLILFM